MLQKSVHYSITDESLDKDLEVDLGMDSLELIRIVTKLEKQLGKVDRQALLSCRTLSEILSVLSSRTVNTSSTPVTVSQDLTEIPYLEIIKQVQRTPNGIAIIDGKIQITYRQLHLVSNQVANYLKTQGVNQVFWLVSC